ncbi:MAG TPA: hypothetical protein VLT33_24845 [Labilithrix sp.]|nr:hypothetical protein [Labilithrix sp.]
MNLLRLVLLAVFGLLVLATPAPARADEIAPELETAELRAKAETEAKRLVANLAASDRRRLVGVYVAFDANASDPSAMVACDDDGDYVIVVTDAMLRLASLVARAQSYDEANGSHAIEDYAEFVARSQIPGRRLVPPPSGFFTAPIAESTHESRLREALAFVMARELAHLRAGDLVCGRPTATHEHGDDVWTAAEQQRALETAARIYRGPAATRDAEATTRILEMGRNEEGALGLLRFFAQLEIERATHGARFSPTYLVQHPNAAARSATVKAAAKDHRTP